MEEINTCSLGHLPSTEQWVFDDEVARVFPDMLRRSIPQYDIMRRAVYDIGVNYVQAGSHIVDLGCSRGDSLDPFIATFGADNRYYGIDNSLPMIRAAQERFRRYVDQGVVRIAESDLARHYPQVPASLTLCILTLQFIAPEYRAGILADAYRNTLPGGALILVEKVRGATPAVDELLIHLYHRMKHANGYSWEEIERKRDALKGVLIPETAQNNIASLRSAGFSDVDCFWRWMNFAGYVALK